MNWAPVIEFGAAVLAVLLGVLCGIVAIVAAADPEGRGAGIAIRLLACGGVLVVGGIGAALYIVFS
ncbi:MAG TPA: hypothetical protein VJ577_11450 [Burkholderiaceae bacterium]|nr:hypothetical protein [Burkholderiaceae bacterium]